MDSDVSECLTTHIDELHANLDSFFNTLNEGGDYELAIGAHSYIEECVRTVLLASLLGTQITKAGELTCPGIPRSYAQMLTLAGGMGKAPPKMKADLDRLRVVRNRFAHAPNRASFSDYAIVEPLIHTHALSNFPETSTLRIQFSASDPSEFIHAAARTRFTWICAHAASALLGISRRASPPESVSDNIWLTPFDTVAFDPEGE